MTGLPIELSREERCCLLMALYERQEALRANLDRVMPAMVDLGEEDVEWLKEHSVNAFDELSALVIKLGGDPTDYLFGAMKMRKGASGS